MQNIINRYWADFGHQNMFIHISDRTMALKGSAGGGFVFRKDGTFEEIKKPALCQQGRQQPYTGTWEIRHDTLCVYTNQSKKFRWKIIKTDGETFTYKDAGSN